MTIAVPPEKHRPWVCANVHYFQDVRPSLIVPSSHPAIRLLLIYLYAIAQGPS